VTSCHSSCRLGDGQTLEQQRQDVNKILLLTSRDLSATIFRMNENKVKKAVIQAGGQAVVARACGVRQQTVFRWVHTGHLPRTEWTGETNYSSVLASMDGVNVTRKELLATRIGTLSTDGIKHE
jgi:hypothetical protein